MSRPRIGTWFLRCGILLLLVAAWVGVELPIGQTRRAPVLVLDVSRSVGPRLPRVATPGDWRPERLHVGKQPGWSEVAKEAPRVDRDGTALRAALRAARDRFPGHPVLLVSDGRGTDGSAIEEALALRAAGGRLYTLLIDPPPIDVAIDHAVARRAGEAVEIDVRVVANADAQVRVAALVGTRVVARSGTLALGATRPAAVTLRVPGNGVSTGGAAWQIVLEPSADTVNDDPENDSVRVGVRGASRGVLVVGDVQAPRPAEGSQLVVRQTQRLRPEDLIGQDLVIIANARYVHLAGALPALRAFVAGGGQLMLLGAPASWGGGGWAGTALERDLAPLRVPTPPENGVQILLLLDHSGSTKRAVLAHLKAAATAAVADLKPGEQLAILPFAAQPARALLGPGFVGAKAPADADPVRSLEGALELLEARGETDLLAALSAAPRWLDPDAPGTRLVVLLSDGDPDGSLDPQALEALRDRWQAGGIDFAALLVGDPEAARLLATHMATRAGSVVDLGEDAETFRRVLERMLYRRRQRQDRLPAPADLQAAAGTRWPLAFPEALQPRSLQPVELHPEGTLRLQARFAEAGLAPVPFLATRTVGAGRVIGCAWGPPLARDSRRRIETWEALVPFIERWAAQSDRGLAGQVLQDRLEVRWREEAGAGRLLVLPAGRAAPLVETAPGTFVGRLDPGEDAPTAVRAPASGAERALRLPQRPPAEHRGAGPDVATLDALARAGGGTRVTKPESVASIRAPRRHSLAPWLLLGACILVLIDAVRSGGGRSEV